jgi:hypothetical protein
MKAKNVIIASAAAMLLISGAVVARADSSTPAKLSTCAGVNSCKGQGACKTATNGCAGQNSCKGQGILFISSASCQKKGGKEVKKGT